MNAEATKGTEMSRLRVGVIGLGEVAQVIHLPVLESLPDRFELAAVCDISPGLLKRLGDRYGVERRYTDAAEMIAAGGLDCVLVLNSDEYHAECAVAALDAGLHVLVEKPMCLSPREAEEIIAARDRSGKHGDGRLHAALRAGVHRGRRAAARARRDQLRAGARHHRPEPADHRPDGSRSSGPTTSRRRRSTSAGARRAELVQEALGDVPEELAWTYRLLCGLGSHDLSAMRELLGRPEQVAAAQMWRQGGYIVALLDYGDFVVTYETGVDDQLRFDAHIEVYGAAGSLQGPVRHAVRPAPADDARARADRGRLLRAHVIRPHLKDPYTYELEYFHDVVTTAARRRPVQRTTSRTWSCSSRSSARWSGRGDWGRATSEDKSSGAEDTPRPRSARDLASYQRHPTVPDLPDERTHRADRARRRVLPHQRLPAARPADVLARRSSSSSRASSTSTCADKGDKLSDELDTPHYRDARLLDFLLSDEVLDTVEPLVGPDIALWSSHFISKDPFTGRETPWHEDSAFWNGRFDSVRRHRHGLAGAGEPEHPRERLHAGHPGHPPRPAASRTYVPTDMTEQTFHAEIAEVDEDKAVDFELQRGEFSHARRPDRARRQGEHQRRSAAPATRCATSRRR